MSNVDFLVKLRDAACLIKDTCEEQLEKMAPAEMKEKKETPAVVEQVFLCLKFEAQKGQKIGDFDVAYEPQNLAQNWNSAMSILRSANAIIEKRYHGPGYQFSYWLFGERAR
jgi:hypothetical protein